MMLNRLLISIGLILATTAGTWLYIPSSGFTNLHSLHITANASGMNVGPSAGDFDGSSGFTLLAWAKLPSLSGQKHVFTKQESVTFRGYVLVINDNGLFFIAAQNFGGGDYLFVQSLSGVIPDTGWHHFAYVFTNKTAAGQHAYVDGAEIPLSTVTDALSGSLTSTSDLVLGGTLFQGWLDEQAVVPAALSGGQIAAIYNGGLPASLSAYTASGWWRYELNTDDSGSGGNAGTLFGTTAYDTDVP
jgi:hypothetical protein